VATVGNRGGAWQLVPRWQLLATVAARGNSFLGWQLLATDS
jgi:hypothetical protein